MTATTQEVKAPRVISFDKVVEVNVLLFVSAACVLLAWPLWTWERQYVHVYLVAIFLFIGGTTTLINGLRMALGEFRKQWEVNRLWRESGGNRSARFLTRAELESAGCFDGGRLIGMLEGEPLFAPARLNQSHSIYVAANGYGKTSCGVMPTVMSLAHQMANGAPLSVLINDSKDGEIIAQAAPMLDSLNIDYAILDDYERFPGHPKRVAMNPFSELAHAYEQDRRSFREHVEAAMHTLLPSPVENGHNEYFYTEPRLRGAVIVEYLASLKNSAALQPGAVWTILNDPKMFEDTLRLIARSGDEAVKGEAKKILQYMEQKHEHEAAHVGAVLQALVPFAAGGWLHDLVPKAGTVPVLTHRELMGRPKMLFVVGRSDLAPRAKAYFGLHLQAVMQAQTTSPRWEVHYIGEEAASTPLKEMTQKMQVLRGQGARIHIVTQSRSGLEASYGALATKIIFNEAIVKQYFGFSSPSEAKQLSDAMGQKLVVVRGINQSSERSDIGIGYSLIREPLMSADQLMSMNRDEQIIHIGGLGYVHCHKVHASHIGPYARLLGPNPVEQTPPVVNIKFNL